MPTYNPKQLGEPEVIREINPTVLFAFLQPFEGYLRSRGLVIKKESRIDNAAIEKLVDILTNPTMKTPQALLNAVFYVEEMATPSAADLLLNAALQAGMPFDEEGKHSLADIVMQVWLFDSKMVEAQHAWHTWKTPRRMECFQPANLTGIAPIAITEERLAQAIIVGNMCSIESLAAKVIDQLDQFVAREFILFIEVNFSGQDTIEVILSM